jgi:AraC-like DNA-binding protein
MPQPPQGPTVSGTLINILKLYADRLGTDFGTLAHEAGVELTTLEDGQARVPARCVASIWRRLVSADDDPHPGLRFGQEMTRHYPGGSVLFTLMLNCPTIGCALENFIRYHRIMADIVQPLQRQVEDRVHLSWEAPFGYLPLHDDLAEALICIYNAILTHLSQGRLQPVEIRFTHPAPDDLSGYQRVFEAPLRFGAAQNELVIKRAALALEIQLANRDLYKLLERHASRIADTLERDTGWQHRVMRLTSEMLMRGSPPDIEAVAKALALSRRTLQARLESEGTTFRRCLQAVRKQTALDYLSRPGASICDVAFLLGYSEQSAFNHAFKRWTGHTPMAYRRSLK